MNWLTENWQTIAIVIGVVSETLAFIPTKVKGVLHSLVLIGNALIKKPATK
jgi:hypothetical protein